MLEIYGEEKAYIRRLRDVETKIQVLNKRKNIYEKDIDYLSRPYVIPEAPMKPIINVLEIMEEAMLVFCIIGILFLCALSSGKVVVVLCIGAVFFMAYLCYIFVRTNKERTRYKWELLNYEHLCEKNQQHIKADRLVIETRLEAISEINSELEKLLSEREWIYEENPIPEECRNIRCIYYIYDMVVNEKLSLKLAVESLGTEGLGALLEKYDEEVEVECMRLVKA